MRWTIAPGFVRVAAFGSASRDDVVAAIGAATRALGFERGMGLLLDGRAMTADNGASLSHDDLRVRASGMAAMGFGRCALIAAVDAPAREGSASVVAPAATYGLPTAVFSDPANAERWLLSYTRR